MRRTSGGIAATVIVLVSVALAGFLVFNRQRIIDQIQYWQYTPSTAISSLADDAGLNSTGKFYLYASQPAIEEKSQFGHVCQNQDPSTSVLGCYVNDHIYIYDVTDTRLAGIKSVTAAHEMLHAAYDRLSASDKKHVNAMVETAYAKLKDQDDLRARMAVYAKTEPGQRDNELHSVLGTEVADLPADLSQYYQKYFSDRSKVVALHAAYQSVFTNVQNQANQLESELKALQAKIVSDKQSYEAQLATVNAAIADFNAKASNGGGFTSESQFTAQRQQLVDQVNALNDQRADINNEIDEFNTKNEQLAALDTQVQQLNKSIDSSLPAAPQI